MMNQQLWTPRPVLFWTKRRLRALWKKHLKFGLFETSSEPPEQILRVKDEVSPAQDAKSEPKKTGE